MKKPCYIVCIFVTCMECQHIGEMEKDMPGNSADYSDRQETSTQKLN